jgi:hypothetical protein
MSICLFLYVSYKDWWNTSLYTFTHVYMPFFVCFIQGLVEYKFVYIYTCLYAFFCTFHTRIGGIQVCIHLHMSICLFLYVSYKDWWNTSLYTFTHVYMPFFCMFHTRICGYKFVYIYTSDCSFLFCMFHTRIFVFLYKFVYINTYLYAFLYVSYKDLCHTSLYTNTWPYVFCMFHTGICVKQVYINTCLNSFCCFFVCFIQEFVSYKFVDIKICLHGRNFFRNNSNFFIYTNCPTMHINFSLQMILKKLKNYHIIQVNRHWIHIYGPSQTHNLSCFTSFPTRIQISIFFQWLTKFT